MDHFDGEKSLYFPLKSVETGMDTLFLVEDYHYVIKPLLKVAAPDGYLVPTKDTALVKIVRRNHFEVDTGFQKKNHSFLGYEIIEVEMSKDEGLKNKDPKVVQHLMNHINPQDYLYVPVRQLRRSKLIQAFEPEAMWEIGNYDRFYSVIKSGKLFPILRVE